jgi:hypothetical protein
MPTIYPRIQTTRTPRVDRIIAAGRERWPDEPPGEILVRLAERALSEERPSSRLIQFDVTGGDVLTAATVSDLLDAE